MTDCIACQSKTCINFEGQCYYIISGVNWFEARHECQQMALKLLDITSNNIIKYIAKLGYKDDKFWTAFHREDWYNGTYLTRKAKNRKRFFEVAMVKPHP